MRPNSRCRSLTLVHLLHRMPTAAWEVVTAAQFAKTVWRAATQRNDAADRGCGLTAIRQQWEAASADIAPAVEEYRLSIAQGNGRANATVAKRAWSAVRGPIGATIMTLARLGWKMSSAFNMVDCKGDDITLTMNSPALVRHLLIEAVEDAAEREVGLVGQRLMPHSRAKESALTLPPKQLRGGEQVSSMPNRWGHTGPLPVMVSTPDNVPRWMGTRSMMNALTAER